MVTSDRIVAVIQARLGSVRFPAKVLAEAAGRPLLDLLVERLRQARTVDAIVLAIPTGPSDDALAAHAARLGIACVRGGEHDLIDRYQRAAFEVGADVVVRITADCPLVDPDLVDRAVMALVEGATTGPRPDGPSRTDSTSRSAPRRSSRGSTRRSPTRSTGNTSSRPSSVTRRSTGSGSSTRVISVRCG